MDALRSSAMSDQHSDADGGVDIFRDSDSDTEDNLLRGSGRGSHRYPPPAYDKAAHTGKPNGACTEAQPALLAGNFYKVLSPAHRVERELELYLNQQNQNSITLKVQVKIIFDKPVEGLQSEGSSAAAKVFSAANAKSKNDDIDVQVDSGSGERDVLSHHEEDCDDDVESIGDDGDGEGEGEGGQVPHTVVIDLTDSDTDNPSATAPIVIEDVDATKKKNAEALRCLLESVSKSILVRKSRLTARNIKVQENNDLRRFSTTFISLPTLNPRTLALEALSVVYMGPAEVREEAWKQLRALQFTANLRNSNSKKKS